MENKVSNTNDKLLNFLGISEKRDKANNKDEMEKLEKNVIHFLKEQGSEESINDALKLLKSEKFKEQLLREKLEEINNIFGKRYEHY